MGLNNIFIVFCVSIFFSFFSFYNKLYAGQNVYIVPSKGYEKNPTEFEGGVFIKLKQAVNTLGYECHFVSFYAIPDLSEEDTAYLILIDFSHIPDFKRFTPKELSPYPKHVARLLSRFSKDKLVLMCFEPEAYDSENHDPVMHELFGKVITCYDNFKGQKYHKFCYPINPSDRSGPVHAFGSRKLAMLMNNCKYSNHPNELYSQRVEVIKFFEKLKEVKKQQNIEDVQVFEFYGSGWGKKKYVNYKGSVPDKTEVLKQYRFCYCFENTKNVTGYISEKILDCLSAGCVPIYWGATNIERYIPNNCYLRREDFDSLQDIYDFIKNMPEDMYQEYLNNIKNYLSSDAVLLFSHENFLNTVLHALFPGYDRTKIFTQEQMGLLAKIDSLLAQNKNNFLGYN